MSDFELKVTGLREVQQSLYSYSQQLGDKVVIDALKLGARLMQSKARANAPKLNGVLRKGIVVRKSRIYNGRRNDEIGVYLGLKKYKSIINKFGKSVPDPRDPYYGKFIENGWNTHGKLNELRRNAKLKRTVAFTRRSIGNSRITQPGKTNVPGIKFMATAFESTKNASAQLIISAVEQGAEVLKRKVGLK